MTKILGEGEGKILVPLLKVTVLSTPFNLGKYFCHEFSPPILLEKITLILIYSWGSSAGS